MGIAIILLSFLSIFVICYYLTQEKLVWVHFVKYSEVPATGQIYTIVENAEPWSKHYRSLYKLKGKIAYHDYSPGDLIQVNILKFKKI